MTKPDKIAGNNPTELITSATNPQIKALKSLERKKGRREHNAFLAEGARLIEEALDHDWQAQQIICSPNGLERDYVQELVDRVEAAGGRRLVVHERLLGSIARKDNPQTVLATFSPRHRSLADIPSDDLTSGTLLALYQVRDPGNLGTILRTSDFAGVKGVILIGDCCDPYSFEGVRASMGSLFAMPFYLASEDEFLSWKAGLDRPMIAASMNGTTPHHTAPYGDKPLVIMGNEQSGLPDHVESSCDVLARIPMREGADSLNLANATALMIYAAWGARGYEL
ncbi:MAG: RNA methyltransferase [Ponticaulis sp.]|nr:RNA methyltransferase [Ponticaulis sp.]|tara:strand:- start:10322 stop:11167 length:846 start_codon:yes stop_codon:yes gene_type:complete